MKDKYYDDPQIIEEEYEEIDIMELLRKLAREWKRIVKWCAVAAVVGVVIALSLPKVYSVSSKMVPESVTHSGGGSLSSLASLAGISLGSMSTSDAVYPDLYPDIVSSTPFVVELFPVEVSFQDGKETVKADYYTYLKEYQKSAWWSVILRAPFKALGWCMDRLRGKSEPVEGFASLDPAALTVEQEEIAKAVRKSVQLSVDKKNSVISLTVTAQDPQVAAVISEEVIERLKTYVTNYRTEKSRQDVEYYETLYAEAKDAYFTSQQAYANYVDRNQGVILQRVKTEQERLQNEMNLNYQLYNACAQQLQTARAKVQQETPVFTIINPPQVPNKKSKPKRATILAACIFLGGTLAAVRILWGSDPKKKEEEEEAAPAKA